MDEHTDIKCSHCGECMVAVTFIENEEKINNGYRYRTGRKRCAVSHLECPNCFHKEAVDDSMDGPWF